MLPRSIQKKKKKPSRETHATQANRQALGSDSKEYITICLFFPFTQSLEVPPTSCILKTHKKIKDTAKPSMGILMMI